MNPSLQLVFDEIRRKFDEFDARWERRFTETRAAREQRDSAVDLRVGNPERYPAAPFEAPVVADNWGGLFEQPAHISVSTRAAAVGADVAADNWGGLFHGGDDSIERYSAAPPIVADNWGGLFEQPAHIPEERVLDLSAPDAAFGSVLSGTVGEAASTDQWFVDALNAPAPRPIFGLDTASDEPIPGAAAARAQSDAAETPPRHAAALAKAAPAHFASGAPRPSLKYQLPQDDLDSLISVTSDDDDVYDVRLPTRAPPRSPTAGAPTGAARRSPSSRAKGSKVSATARHSDSELIVIDAAKGLRLQIHAALRQSFVERLRPCTSATPHADFLTAAAAGPDPLRVALVVASGAILVNAALLEAVTSLSCVVTSAAGVIHIDLALRARRGIVVAGASEIFSLDLADHAVELLVGVLRRVVAADRYVRAGLWPPQGNNQAALDPPLDTPRLLQLVVPEEEGEVSSTLPNRCSMNCRILIQNCFSHPTRCRWDAVLYRQHRPWPTPLALVIQEDRVSLRPTPWPSFCVATQRFATDATVVEKVEVAVRTATREISKTAIIWALTHVVQPGGRIILLVVIPAQRSGSKFWGFLLFAGDCASGHKSMLDEKCDLSELCSQLMRKLDEYDIDKINVRYKLVSGSPSGVAAAECKQAQASWVVLDKDLMHEKRGVEELQCSIVVMKHSQPKVLRLNLVGSADKESKATYAVPPVLDGSTGKTAIDVKEAQNSIHGPAVTPNSSPDLETSCGSTEAGTSSLSSSDPGMSPFSASETNGSLKEEVQATKDIIHYSDADISDSDSETLSHPANFSLQPWMSDILQRASSRSLGKVPRKTRTATADALLEKISKLDLLNEISAIRSRSDLNFRGDVRDAVSLARNAPPGPPPLCSICQNKTPVFWLRDTFKCSPFIQSMKCLLLWFAVQLKNLMNYRRLQYQRLGGKPHFKERGMSAIWTACC